MSSAANASISGIVFDDSGRASSRHEVGPGLAGRTVYIDLHNDDLMEPDDPRAVTDANGNYTLLGLSGGNYVVRQVVPAGWGRSYPVHNFGQHVTLKDHEAAAGVNLGEVPVAAIWSNYGGNAQHTGLSAVGSQSLDAIKWSAPVDLAPQIQGGNIYIHYGSPLFTADNVMILPVKTGPNDGFELQGRNAATGEVLWVVSTDFVLPPHDWTPSYSPALTSNNRIYFAGAGGTVYYIDRVDRPGAKVMHQLAFYGMSNYLAHKSSLDSTLFIDTPLTVDTAGNLYFGLQTTGDNALHLTGGIARISASGKGTYISAATAANDPTIEKVAQNCAPALSNDGKILYLAVNRSTEFFSTHAAINAPDYLLALDSTTLKSVGRAPLIDPGDGNYAVITDDGTASPMIGPDGDVYYGILDSTLDNDDRGWMLHFNKHLTVAKTPGAFGWDDTASVVPASMVPSYRGKSSYLLMTKYNEYADFGGSGINKLAILDPNAAAVDPFSGQTTMQVVESIAGVTPDPKFPTVNGAVREWCINTAAVDPYTNSILAGNEDGKLYRWDLRSNSFTQVVTLTSGIGEAYTPTMIAPDGTVYAINDAILFAVGN